MATTGDRRSPVRRHLEAYGEAWKRDHDEAMECRDWEDFVALGLAVYDFLRERETRWRDLVFRGSIPVTQDDCDDHLWRLRYWLEVTDDALRDQVEPLVRTFGTVKGAAELRFAVEEVQQAVRDWRPPALSPAVGLRDMALDAAAATEFDRRMASPAPPVPPGMVPTTLTADELRRRLGRS